MQQVLHILVVDIERRLAVAEWYAGRWLLPVVCCPPRTRPSTVVGRWLISRSVVGDVVGQWLGRPVPSGDGFEWLIVVRAVSEGQGNVGGTLGWAPLDSLTSSTSLVTYQAWAVTATMSNGAIPSAPGPFGKLQWIDDAKAWVRGVIGSSIHETVTSYRTSPYEVVISLFTSGGRVFFKGLTADRSLEANVTVAMSRTAPESFARTLALETRADGSVWWLTEECPGTTLAQNPTIHRAIRVAVALAEVQQRVAGAHTIAALPRVDLSRVADWATVLLEECGLGGTVERACTVIRRVCQQVSASKSPQSWIPLDLDPANVLLDDVDLRFIDLDSSYVGAAPLSIATFARRLQRLHCDWQGPDACDAIYASYERSWLSCPPARGEWAAFKTASALIEAYHGWTQVVKKTERGEVSNLIDLAKARIVSRLCRLSTESAASR